MKILVAGTGVIGTIYGWALSEAGADVTHLVRRGRAASLASKAALDLLDERKGHPAKQAAVYRWNITETASPVDGYELVIVPTNAHQLAEALSLLTPLSAGRLLLGLFLSQGQNVKVIVRSPDHLP